MAKKLLSELSSNLRFLSPVERRIAQIILNDPKKFTTYSMVELSEIAEVSHGSIINFSNKFAGGGFPMLKLKVAEGLSDYTELPFSAAEKNDTVSRVLRKNIADTLTAYNNTANINEESTLERVAEMILSAKKVELFGVFRSAVVASNFHFELLQLGIPASFVTDVLSSAISASMLDPDCLAFAVSSSGKTKEVIDAVRTAKEKGVPVVSITSNKNSPLAKLSDEVLIAASSGKTIIGTPTEVQFSQMLLTDALCTYLRARIDTDGEKRYWALRSILNSHNVED
ncbi:MAG: MurR/RpiR family transcriptional regulator [Clostridia bacterium]|nr:MurR/RpiR family transcriptional regulator [Clostridia bacterium]